jgi:hypothetical protein
LTSAAGVTFTSEFVGKAITVVGAGAAAATLSTTVESVTSATEIELAAAAATTVTGASYSAVNPGFVKYVVNKAQGSLRVRLGAGAGQFYTPYVAVTYTAGWKMPGETGRTLPKGIEDACVAFCRVKIDQLQEGDDFSGPLTQATVDGVEGEKLDHYGFGLTLGYHINDNLGLTFGYKSTANDSAPDDLQMDVFMISLVYGWHPIIEGSKRLQGE